MSRCPCATCDLTRRVDELERLVARLHAQIGEHPELHAPKELSPEEVAKYCAGEWGVPVAWVLGKGREQRACQARHAAWLILGEVAGLTQEEIAEPFGRDRSTVSSNVVAFTELLARDGFLRLRVQAVCRRIGISAPEVARDKVGAG